MPKKSLYNHFQRWDNGHSIAYNARSGAVALMTDENYAMYLDLMARFERGEGDGLNPAEADLVKKLEYGSFVRPDGRDEVEGLRFLHNSTRYASESLALVIAPTMACNMACEYCYEESKTGKLSPEIQDALVNFVDKRGQALRHLNISWYGGEPLLALDVIEGLTDRFRELGRKHQFEYSASIVTNGYLLTPANVERLRAAGVDGGQVTLDGPADVHNRKRPLRNGKDSFSTILENLKFALTKLAISIRVNIDQTFTVETIDRLLTDLSEAGLGNRAAINFGHLEPATKACANIAESCLETPSYSRAEAEFFKLLLERGFSIGKLPAPSAVCCMAQTVNAFVVDPQGELYRCWNYVGDLSRSMGNIRNPLDFQHPNFQRLFSVDPFDLEECRKCNLLPLCMGGCPSKRRDRDLPGEAVCESWKYNLEPMLEILAAAKLRERAAALPRQEDEKK